VAKAKGVDAKRASRDATYPGDIIPEWRAKSSRNAERHQIGMGGEIIPESRATSVGIRTSGVGAALEGRRNIAAEAGTIPAHLDALVAGESPVLAPSGEVAAALERRNDISERTGQLDDLIGVAIGDDGRENVTSIGVRVVLQGRDR
jgi:hypothetical protein